MRRLIANTLSRSAIITAAPVVVALILSGIISFTYNVKLKNFRDAADHTFKTMSAIDGVLMRLQDSETGQLGYIITGSPDYLSPFESGQRDLDATIASLKTLMSDNSAQTARLQRLAVLAQAKISEMSETITVRERDGFAAARDRVINNVGKRTMDEIRAVAGEVRQSEEELLQQRIESARFAERMMVVVAIACVGLSLLGRFLAHLLKAKVAA